MSSTYRLLEKGSSDLYTTHEDYSSCTSKFLGVCRILFGLTLIAHWVTELILYRVYVTTEPFDPNEAWIQAATFLILSGAAGCVAANRKNTAAIVTHMIISLISVTLFGITKLFASGLDLSNLYIDEYSDKERGAVLPVFCLTLVTSFLGCVFDFWAFGISYSAFVSGPSQK